MLGLFALILAFVAAQGAAVFSTAHLGLRALRGKHWLAKVAAMVLSYAAWIASTVIAYFWAGGDGSFMKGFAIVLALCMTALASSLVYLAGWLIWPLALGKRPRFAGSA